MFGAGVSVARGGGVGDKRKVRPAAAFCFLFFGNFLGRVYVEGAMRRSAWGFTFMAPMRRWRRRRGEQVAIEHTPRKVRWLASVENNRDRLDVDANCCERALFGGPTRPEGVAQAGRYSRPRYRDVAKFRQNYLGVPINS